MELNRTEFINELDVIIDLVKTLQTAVTEEPNRLNLTDIEELTDMIEGKLKETIDMLKS